MFRPPLALGGHCFARFDAGCSGPVTLLSGPERPSWWTCVSCHLHLPGHLVREGFYPRPCMGAVAMLVPVVKHDRRP
jgi:hypothetical protein